MNVEAPGGAPVAETDALAARTFADKSAAFLRLAAGVAHELRNPLAVILARAQLLALEIAQGRRPEPVKIESVLKIIEEQAIRASGIIESLSMFARPRRPVLDALDTATVVQDALQTLRQRAEAAGVTVEVAIEQAPVTLSADREQLVTALTHLACNALDAMEAGGRLSVRVRRGAGSVEIVVADTGPGVAADDAERIFEPFFSTKSEAAGLGLCVAQTIAEAHGGALRLTASDTAGAEFVLALPARS